MPKEIKEMDTEKEMPEVEVEVKTEPKEVKELETPSIEQADCCMCCMSYQPGRMDTGICTRHRTGNGMMETKDTNVCSEFMSKGGEKEEVEE